ncbi:MAG: AAA family ATPase [Deltaproteobacteria bacterium]|nr:AAA family ATPase [Deltaproteobacteria bacterium]
MEKKPGNLKLVAMPRLLYVIHRKGYPFSVLDVSREAVRKHFYFKDGRPVGSSSNVLNEVLGRLLMQEGVLTQELYERSLEKVIKEKRRHGEVLISMGLLTEAGLDEFLSLQTKRRIWKVFGWEDGEYRYRRAHSLPVGLGGPGFEPAELILEGISHGFYPPGRVIEELKEYMDKPVAINGEKAFYNAAQFGLNLQESRFLESLDGKKNLKVAIAESDLLRQRSLALALSFIITDTVVAGAPAGAEEHREEHPAEHHVIEPTPGQANADERFNAELLFMKAKSAMNRGAWPDAVSSLKTIIGLNPSEAEYQAYLGWAMFNENPDKANPCQEVIRASLKLNKELSIGWRFLGLVSLAVGDDDSAFEELTEALNKNRWQSDILSEIKRLEIKKTAPGNAREYMAAYGFKADPFSKVPDKRFFSSLSSQTRTLEALIKVVKHGAGHCLVTGADGIGKTTLALELLSRLGDEKILSVFVLDPAQTDLGFLKTLNKEAGEPVLSTSVKDQLLHVGMIVSKNRMNNAGTLMIIDKAHVLTAEAVGLLQEIMRLPGLQILLLAEASFEETLNKDWFKEVRASISTRLSLDPMTFEETEVYIMKRLEACYGISPGFTLTDRALEHVFRESNGAPAKVNEVMSGLLGMAAAQPEFTTAIDLYPKEEIKKPLSEEHKEPEPPHRPIKQTRHRDAAPKPSKERVETMPPKQENKQMLKLLLWSLAMLAIGFFIGSLVGALR